MGWLQFYTVHGACALFVGMDSGARDKEPSCLNDGSRTARKCINPCVIMSLYNSQLLELCVLTSSKYLVVPQDPVVSPGFMTVSLQFKPLRFLDVSKQGLSQNSGPNKKRSCLRLPINHTHAIMSTWTEMDTRTMMMMMMMMTTTMMMMMMMMMMLLVKPGLQMAQTKINCIHSEVPKIIHFQVLFQV